MVTYLGQDMIALFEREGLHVVECQARGGGYNLVWNRQGPIFPSVEVYPPLLRALVRDGRLIETHRVENFADTHAVHTIVQWHPEGAFDAAYAPWLLAQHADLH